MSTNSTETSRISGPASGFGGTGPGESAEPHSPQNFCPGAQPVPQEGQRSSCAAPHSTQNFAASGTSAPQLEQTNVHP